jgi:hypothetical protein
VSMLREDGVEVVDGEVEVALNRFCELGLMIDEEGSYLSLALPVNSNW